METHREDFRMRSGVFFLRQFRALMVIAAILLGIAVMWQRESGIRREKLGLDMAPGIDEPGPVKEVLMRLRA